MPRRPDMPPLRRADLDRRPDRAVRATGSSAPRARSPLPEAITLATVDADGAPDARMVLLKGFDADGLSLLHQLRVGEGPASSSRRRRAALVALLARARPPGAGPRAGRAARRGRVRRLLRRPAPRDSQTRRLGLAAVASRSSRASELDDRVAEAEARFAGGDVPAARRTGAATCCVRETIEFWQGQVGRLHDRFRYTPRRRRLADRAARALSAPERLRRGRCRGRTRAARRCRRSWSSARMPVLRGADPDPVAERLLERLLGAQQRRLLVRMRDDLRPSRRLGPPSRAARSRAPTSRRRPRRGRAGGGRRCPSRCRIARPWPSLSSPSESSSSTSSGRSSRRIRFEIAGRVRPRRPRELLLREPEILDQRRAGARLVDRVEVLAGDVLDQRRLHPPRRVLVADHRRDDSSPASRAARQRRSPAISS